MVVQNTTQICSPTFKNGMTPIFFPVGFKHGMGHPYLCHKILTTLQEKTLILCLSPCLHFLRCPGTMGDRREGNTTPKPLCWGLCGIWVKNHQRPHFTKKPIFFIDPSGIVVMIGTRLGSDPMCQAIFHSTCLYLMTIFSYFLFYPPSNSI